MSGRTLDQALDIDTPIEEWRDIPGYEGLYRISTLGRVYSVRKGDYLSTNTVRPGYPTVTLNRDGIGWTRPVHRIVMWTFVGPRPEGHQVRHLNGDSTDARLVNLAYGTQSDNQQDSLRHGTHSQASKTTCPNNHPYTEDNTYLHNGRRNCRECGRAACRRYRAELRARVEKLARRDGCPDCGLEHDVAECNGAQCDCCAAIEREATQ